MLLRRSSSFGPEPHDCTTVRLATSLSIPAHRFEPGPAFRIVNGRNGPWWNPVLQATAPDLAPAQSEPIDAPEAKGVPEPPALPAPQSRPLKSPISPSAPPGSKTAAPAPWPASAPCAER